MMLARALFSVARRAGAHEVLVTAGSRRAQVYVRDGRLEQVDGVDAAPLGDTLLRHGVLDLGRHADALPERSDSEPVGQWLVRVGAADQHAVDQAVQMQQHEELLRNPW